MRRTPTAAVFDLNLAPMVDVMMCLLIFFMLATRMVEQENSRIDLPAARAAQDQEIDDSGSRFVVNVTQSGKQAEPVYLIREEPRTLAQVLEFIEEQGREHPDARCVIRADRSLAYGHVEAILQGCTKAGVRNITFSAMKDEGGRS
jgi:biopolymer transport protein ExbD